jgi:uncharacterized membrane protein
MSENLYPEIRERVERRLSKPRIVTLHSVAFGAFALLSGVVSLNLLNSGIASIYHFIIAVWSVILAAHVGLAYLRSGAWAGAREKALAEEVQAAGEIDDLSSDEMIDLHQRLSQDIKTDSQTFSALLLFGVGSAVLWAGILATAMIFGPVGSLTPGELRFVLIFSMLGTLVLGLGLPYTQFMRNQGKYKDLRALYGEHKPKRRTTVYAPSTHLTIRRVDDEGERSTDDEGERSTDDEGELDEPTEKREQH